MASRLDLTGQERNRSRAERGMESRRAEHGEERGRVRDKERDKEREHI